MKVVPLGSGSVPSVAAIPGGWRIAIGERGHGILVLDVDAEGRTIVERTFAGYSYPVLDGPWLGYKCHEADGWKARLRNLDTGGVWTYDPATGNFPLAIGHGVFVWQVGADYAIRYVELADPTTPFTSDVGGLGAPDGIAWIEPTGHMASTKAVRRSVEGMVNPSRCGSAEAYTYVGEQPDLGPQWPLGIATRVHPTVRNGWTLGGQECNTPKIAVSADRASFAVVTYGREGVRLLLLTAAELASLPKPPTAPSTPEPPRPPTPRRSDRFWFCPNIASPDLVRLFDDPGVLTMGVFKFYTQQILDNGGTVTGPNTFANLSANHVFKKLQAAGIATALEGGSLSDLEAVTKIRAQGGDVHYLSISEPLVAKTPIADVVAVIKATKALGVKAGWIEAFSAHLLPAQHAFLAALSAAGAKPDYWHLDIDRQGAVRDRRDVGAFVREATAVAAQAGVPLGIILWGDDGHTTDAEYAADTRTFATQVKAMAPVDHVIVQSWAVRQGGKQDIPANLGPSGLLASLNAIVPLFTGTTTPIQVPIPNPPKEFLPMMAYAPPVAGFLAGAFAPHPDGDGVIVVKPNGTILCVTPDGGVEERPRSSPGAWEKFTKGKNALIASRDGGKVYVLPFTEA